jgi:hypothetical protein
MTRWDAIRERYMRDKLDIRLGGLAANLARLVSFSGRMRHHGSIDYLIEESKWFIEWSAPDALPEMQAELVELQIQLAVWHRVWLKGPMNETQLHEMASQARAWSNRLLERSGLLEKG